ncbi:MAG TPA: hypothetical protein VMS01_02960 [Stellaceae bacterium]|nr:hypothetical protein [Stellaceae bacterium]
MASRVALGDVIELFFFVDVDQHVALDSLGNAGALDLARLEDDVAIGQDDRPRPAAQSFQHIERTRIYPIGKRVIDQPRGHRQEMNVLGVLDPIALQGSEIVAVAEIGEELLKDRPVAVAADGPELAFEMAAQIGLDAVVVERCVIDIDQETIGLKSTS